MRNRQRQRELKRRQRQEESIDKRNGCGYRDLTPYNAVRQIKTKGKADITLK